MTSNISLKFTSPVYYIKEKIKKFAYTFQMIPFYFTGVFVKTLNHGAHSMFFASAIEFF